MSNNRGYLIPKKNIGDASYLNKEFHKKAKVDALDPQVYNQKLYLYSPFINTNTGTGLTGEMFVNEAEFLQTIVNSEEVMLKYFDESTNNFVVGVVMKQIGEVMIRTNKATLVSGQLDITENVNNWLINKMNLTFYSYGSKIWDLIQQGIIWASFVDLNNIKNLEGENLLFKYPIFNISENLTPFVNADSTIAYVEANLKRVLPYGTKSGKTGITLRWECFQDTQYKIKNVANIKVNIHGPFLWYYFVIFNEIGQPVWMDYNTTSGNLYESSFSIKQSGTQMFLSHKEASEIVSRKTRYDNLVSQSGFSIEEVATSNGIINTRIPAGINFNGQNCMNGKLGVDDGITINNETRNNLNSLVPISIIDMESNGFVNYKLIKYNGGYGDGIDGVGNIFNLTVELLDMENFENVINPFGFALSNTMASKSEQIQKPNLGKKIFGGWNKGFRANNAGNNAKDGLITSNSEKRSQRRENAWQAVKNVSKNIIETGWQYFSKELVEQINSSNYTTPSTKGEDILPRVFADPKPQWKIITNKLYNLDSWVVFSSPAAGGGFVDFYIAAISDIVKNDEQFALSQNIDDFYYLSEQNKLDKAFILNGFENGSSSIDTQDFPMFLRDDTFSDMPCLTPFSIEKWIQLSTSTQFINSSKQLMAPLKKLMFPTNNLYVAPYLLTTKAIELRVDDSMFQRPFIDSDGVSGNKFELWLKPVNNIITSQQDLISQINGFMLGIFGGWKYDFEFFDIEGEKIRIGTNEDDTPKYVKTIIAPNRNNTKLMIGKTMIVANNLMNNENVEDLEKPVIYNFVEIEKTYKKYIINFSIGLINVNQTINGVEVFAFYNQLKYKGNTIFQNNLYETSFDNLVPTLTYTLIFKITYDDGSVVEIKNK